MKREAVRTAGAPAAIGPTPRGAGRRVPLLLGADPARPVDGGNGGRRDRGPGGAGPEEPRGGADRGGATLRSVVKTTVYLVDLVDFPAMNAVYGKFFPEDPPARATVQVVKLPAGARVEIDAVAAAG